VVSTPGADALLERDIELGRLARALAAVESGTGRTVVLYGPAGIGKTELLKAALDRAGEAGLRAALARASEFEREFPFGVARQLLEPLVAEVPATRRDALFRGAAGLARATLGPVPPADDAPADAERGTFATLHGLYWLVVNLADAEPLVLAVDDLQWADPASLRFVSFLARRIEGLPVLLLATLRSDDVDGHADELVDDGVAETIRPPALGEAAIAQLVRAQLGAEPHPRFARACAAATSGNPLFAREMLAALRERGVAPTSAAADSVGQVSPRSVTRLVLRRLSALGPSAERAARVAALVGDGADAELVRTVAELPGGEFADAAHRLRAAELVDVAPRVAFVHPITRAAIVTALGVAERSALAGRAAALLGGRGDLEGQASHLLSVVPAGEPEVVGTLRRAAARAQARGAPGTAVTLLQRALVEPPPPADEAGVLRELGLAELRTRASVAPVHLQAALDLTPPGPQRAPLAEDLARALHNLNRSEEAVAVAQAALAEPAPPGEPAPARERLAVRAVEIARFVPGRAAVEQRIAGAVAAIADPRLRARVGAVRAYDAMLAGDPADAVAAQARGALRDGALTVDTADGSTAGFLACMALGIAGEAEAATEHIDEALDAARRRGSVVSYTGALSVRARLRLLLGDLRGAEADAHEVDELGDEGLGRDYATGWLVESLVGQGRLAEAQAVVDASPLAGVVPDRIVFHAGLHARALLRLAQDRLPEAVADLTTCGERQDALGAVNPGDVPWRGTLALALLGLGRAAEAADAAARQHDAARAFGAPAVVGAAAHVRGVVTAGEEGRALLEEAVTLLERSPAALERSRALLDLGRARHAAGDETGARAALQRAREAADACGAAPLADAAVNAMVAAGGRPRRARARGDAALTPAERRVAEQAARGLSNREIAQALFLTEKTVEGHLSKAYRKLGITARAQLAAALPGGS